MNDNKYKIVAILIVNLIRDYIGKSCILVQHSIYFEKAKTNSPIQSIISVLFIEIPRSLVIYCVLTIAHL